MFKNEEDERIFLKCQQLADLLEEWEITSSVAYSPEIAIVRGWLMDEIERRNPEAFNAWLDGDAKDAELKWYMMQ